MSVDCPRVSILTLLTERPDAERARDEQPSRDPRQSQEPHLRGQRKRKLKELVESRRQMSERRCAQQIRECRLVVVDRG
jgi:hypothetical protein